MYLTLMLAAGLFIVATFLLAVFAIRVNPLRRPWDAAIGAAYAVAVLFGIYAVLAVVANQPVAIGVLTVVVAAGVYRIGEIGDRRRLAQVRQTWQREGRTSDLCLATLPVVPVEVLHPRREAGRCTCLAQAFSEVLERGRPATLAVSTVALSVWRGTPGRYEFVEETPLGSLHDARLVRTVYRFLSPFRGDATDVDGFRLPAGWTHRLRLVMADRSSVDVTVPSRHNARLFIQLATQVLQDGELRILASLERDDRRSFSDLRRMTGMPAVTLATRLGAMAGRDLVSLHWTPEPGAPPASAAITETGLQVLWERAESLAGTVSSTNDIPI